MLKINLTKDFTSSSEEIAIYILSNFGKIYADKFIDDLSNFIDLVAYFPGIGKSYKLKEEVKSVVFKGNLLLFTYTESDIYFINLINRSKLK
jgi:plasmid stabilization system protein ParE